MDYVARLHLKTNTDFRQEMVDFCLNSSEQYVGIGWSRLSEGIKSNDFKEYYNRIKQESGKANLNCTLKVRQKNLTFGVLLL